MSHRVASMAPSSRAAQGSSRLSLYASDLDKVIVYRLDDGVEDKLIALGNDW